MQILFSRVFIAPYLVLDCSIDNTSSLSVRAVRDWQRVILSINLPYHSSLLYRIRHIHLWVLRFRHDGEKRDDLGDKSRDDV